MATTAISSKTKKVFRHPLFIILSAIIIIYGGYLFGQWLHVFFS